jgi:hypothetical protein
MGGDIMIYNENIKKNFMQLGLRQLHPVEYLRILLGHVYWISMDCYERIVQAQDDDNVGSRERETLPCKTGYEEEESFVDIASGEVVDADDEDIIASFITWYQYEDFREEIRNIMKDHKEIIVDFER